MTDKRVDALVSIGFEFDRIEKSSDEQWMSKYETLKEFHVRNQHCAVPYNNNKSLWRWVDAQRTALKLLKKGEKTSLTQERIDLLNDINFIFDPIEDRFNRRLEQVKEYVAKHGYCDTTAISIDDPKLNKWICNQDDQYGRYMNGRKTYLNDGRIAKLKEIGLLSMDEIKLNRRRRGKRPWNEMYMELQQYVKDNGHCMVPSNYPKLGQFVRAQRNSYRLMKMGKNSSMTKERFNKLNTIGFVWYVSNRRNPLEEGTNTRTHGIIINRMPSTKLQIKQSFQDEMLNSQMLLESYKKKSLWG